MTFDFHKIILIIFFLIVGGATGFYLNQISVKPEIVTEGIIIEKEEKVLVENDILLDTDTLLNPILYGWVARARGVLVEKSEDSFVLEQNGEKMVLLIQEGTTRFLKNDGSLPVSLDEMPVGFEISGSVLPITKEAMPGFDGIAGTFTESSN